MKALLMAGLGPYFKQTGDLVGTLFDPAVARSRTDFCIDSPLGFYLQDLCFDGPDGKRHRLLRSEKSGSLSLVLDGSPTVERAPAPNLSASTLISILVRCGVEHEHLPLDAVWDGDREPSTDTFDCILLSTTFICDRATLARAVTWITQRMPFTPIIVGGQFSNLKFEQILRDHPQVVAVVRGDGEVALPILLSTLALNSDLCSVPNIVYRSTSGEIISTEFRYVDFESELAPTFTGQIPIIPYESMRGCPFSCKFCSFPAASPQWRYRSAERIVSDWSRYRDNNGAKHIRALDSTFPIPKVRFRQLLELLPAIGIGWEAYSRANSISTPEIIDALLRANCRTLSIGFESMSDKSLRYMDKKVTAKQNRTAFNLLCERQLGYRVSFIAGYPGERPEDYRETHDFLVDEYKGHFQLSVFSPQDETMPVWQDADRFELRVGEWSDPGNSWCHKGMDAETARSLRRETLRDVRWKNETAVPFLWQTDYQTPVLPHRSPAENYRVEKIIERLAFHAIDFTAQSQRDSLLARFIAQLRDYGIYRVPISEGSKECANSLSSI